MRNRSSISRLTSDTALPPRNLTSSRSSTSGRKSIDTRSFTKSISNSSEKSMSGDEKRPGCVILADAHHNVLESVRRLLDARFSTVVMVTEQESLIKTANAIFAFEGLQHVVGKQAVGHVGENPGNFVGTG